ncbi:MAG: bifunctional oligoribonuclease/PAP phosphatase NrnA [Candidatus Omnitrophica bacterium]|nr:bifunctional oligoribonuclease/PAP phosphatase NrnA [Candidatus Omnitrophota bacterium]
MEDTMIKALKRYKKIAVTMHVNPDPDAVSAALVMALFLRAQGKKVRLLNESVCPKWLDFVPRISLYEQFDEKKHASFFPEALVVLDCGSLDRIGSVADLASKKGVKIINIDHHVTNTRFGDYNLVKVQYSSTCEILFELLKQAKARLTKDIAILLYLGILTDTGSFGFDCTHAHTHEVIAELLRFQFSVSDLYRRVYETMPKHDLKPFLSLMNRLELFSDERVACLTLNKKEAACFSEDFDLKDKIFTFLRSVRGLEVIVILTEQDKKKTRLNFRSRGAFDVARLAEKFQGGGHKKASGGFIDENLTRAKARVLLAIEKEL